MQATNAFFIPKQASTHVHAKGAILQECESKEAGETNGAGPNDLEVSGGAAGACGWGGG